ncbi:MAG: phosphatidate cytidylyltransferase [Epsilonproteobacteria bacterium]|nr:phosphatidate cytidylyltransferase [Campylobacterota bacterium]
MINKNELIKRTLTSIVLILLGGGAYLHSSNAFCALLLTALAYILVFEWPKLIGPRSAEFYFLTPVYPILPVVLLIALTQQFYKYDKLMPLYPFLIAAIADTCGFFVGKLLGQHKLCPKLSPGKTWQGLGGSLLGVFLVNYFFTPSIPTLASLPWHDGPLFIYTISILQTFFALFGGLFASFLKRQKDLKDAGTILPGHGGLLDRFDSVFFTVIIVWVMVILKNYIS